MSSVGDTKTRAPAMRPVDAIVSTPTELSGFCCIFAPTTRFAASCCDSWRVGTKSPFRMNSLVSMQMIVHSMGMAARRAGPADRAGGREKGATAADRRVGGGSGARRGDRGRRAATREDARRQSTARARRLS